MQQVIQSQVRKRHTGSQPLSRAKVKPDPDKCPKLQTLSSRECVALSRKDITPDR